MVAEKHSWVKGPGPDPLGFRLGLRGGKGGGRGGGGEGQGPGPDPLGFRPFRPGLGGGVGGGWGSARKVCTPNFFGLLEFRVWNLSIRKLWVFVFVFFGTCVYWFSELRVLVLCGKFPKFRFYSFGNSGLLFF